MGKSNLNLLLFLAARKVLFEDAVSIRASEQPLESKGDVYAVLFISKYPRKCSESANRTQSFPLEHVFEPLSVPFPLNPRGQQGP